MGKSGLVFGLICILLLAGCPFSSDSPKSITVSAASSLAPALSDIAEKFYEETGIKIFINYAASGTLALQIEQGAPTDVYLSASHTYIKRLKDQDRLAERSIVPLYKNRLVVVTAKQDYHVELLKDLLKTTVKEIAIGQPNTVPAGHYAKQSFISLGIWKNLQSKVIYAKNAEQILTFIEKGGVDIGIAYLSDTREHDQLRVVKKIDSRLHEPIIYYGSVISSSNNKDTATRFLKFVQSDEAMNMMQNRGFQPVRKIK